MTDAPTYTALRAYHRCTTGMYADPELTGELLLIGLWLARAAHLHLPAKDSGSWELADIADDLFPLHTVPAMHGLGDSTGQTTGHDVWKVVGLLRADIRRYDPRADQAHPLWAPAPCAGPMVRRTVCGKKSSTWAHFTDVTDGRRRLVGACRSHVDWFTAARRDNRAAVAADVPAPPANAGGRLARHLPDVDWPALWRGLDPEWVVPPEVHGWAKPKLRLLVSAEVTPDARSSRPEAGFRRPAFAVLRGGSL